MSPAFLAAPILVALAAAGAIAAAPRPPQESVSIALPGDVGFAFKPEPGVEVARRYCLHCHSSAYVSTQPVLTRAQWDDEVAKMRCVYAAPIPEDQVGALVDYLTAAYGKP